MRRRHAPAFTLIELLVVVAIIALLAAIAVPNYMDAQARSKVSVVKNDQRVITLALESYANDFSAYPSAKGIASVPNSPFLNPVSRRLHPLTTPISYTTSVPRDVFRARDGWALGGDADPIDTFDYVCADDVPTRGSGITSGGAWRLSSAGPDLFQAYGGRPVENPDCNMKGVDYDPTNGTRSPGDIVRVGPLHTRHGNPLDPANPNRPGIVRVPRYVEQWQ